MLGLVDLVIGWSRCVDRGWRRLYAFVCMFMFVVLYLQFVSTLYRPSALYCICI